MCFWVYLDLKAFVSLFRFYSPFRATSSLPLLLVLLMSPSVIFTEVAQYPGSQRSKILPRDEIHTTRQLLLIPDENLCSNNGRSARICACVHKCVFVLAQGASPPTVLVSTICVLQSKTSHMLCIRDSKKDKKQSLARTHTG